MEIVGKELSATEVAERVLADAPFFRESGGGVTISGGEPTAQRAFLIETLSIIRGQGVSTAIETCGYFSGAIIPELAGCVDLFLYDIKHIDEKKHVEATGAGPEAILENFRTIVSTCGCDRVIPRIPLIPGFNTDAESTLSIASFLRNAGYSGVVHLMPYNNLAKHKYEKLGAADRYVDRGTLEESHLDNIRTTFIERGFEVYCNY
jgi:pyruvate formate lyase activating enzyme